MEARYFDRGVCLGWWLCPNPRFPSIRSRLPAAMGIKGTSLRIEWTSHKKIELFFAAKKVQTQKVTKVHELREVMPAPKTPNCSDPPDVLCLLRCLLMGPRALQVDSVIWAVQHAGLVKWRLGQSDFARTKQGHERTSKQTNKHNNKQTREQASKQARAKGSRQQTQTSKQTGIKSTQGGVKPSLLLCFRSAKTKRAVSAPQKKRCLTR